MTATAQIRAAQERLAYSVASAAPLRIDPIGGLTGHYGVARMTARQAIQELRTEGRVVAEQGRGV
jgi:GntR family transcriptional regulator